jgi:hypothetical protein
MQHLHSTRCNKQSRGDLKYGRCVSDTIRVDVLGYGRMRVGQGRVCVDLSTVDFGIHEGSWNQSPCVMSGDCTYTVQSPY